MKKAIVLLILATPLFARVPGVLKAATYPVVHPVHTLKAVGRVLW
jgi:hypothetical protein